MTQTANFSKDYPDVLNYFRLAKVAKHGIPIGNLKNKKTHYCNVLLLIVFFTISNYIFCSFCRR